MRQECRLSCSHALSAGLCKTLTTRSAVLCALLCVIAGVGKDSFSHSHFFGAFSCLPQVGSKVHCREGIFPSPMAPRQSRTWYQITSVALTPSVLAHVHPNNQVSSSGLPRSRGRFLMHCSQWGSVLFRPLSWPRGHFSPLLQMVMSDERASFSHPFHHMTDEREQGQSSRTGLFWTSLLCLLTIMISKN